MWFASFLLAAAGTEDTAGDTAEDTEILSQRTPANMSIQLPKQSFLPSISTLTLDEELSKNDNNRSDVLDENNDKQEDDSVKDKVIDEVLQEDHELPKDYGEINVQGYLRFDTECPPDENTQNNTMINAMLYHLTDDESDSTLEPSDSEKKNEVTFDTYSPNLDVSKYQMTFVREEEGFCFRNITRSFYVPYDDEKPSKDAIRWTMSQAVTDNDIVIVLKVVSFQNIMKNGVEHHRQDCKRLFENICKLNVNQTKLKIIVEIRVGAVEYALARGLKDFDPTFMVMGTKGIKKNKLSNILNEDNSMTKHFMDHGWIPIIVVNPLYEQKPISEKDQCKPIDENTFLEALTSYPSVYDPLSGVNTYEMERSQSNESTTSSINGGRTSRFLRIGRSLSRTSSTSRHSRGGQLTPTTSNDQSPARGLSPRRGLSPFRLFHHS